MPENAAGKPAPQLTLATSTEGDVTTVRCTGKLVAGMAGILQDEVRGLLPGSKRIVLDLTHLGYMDSSGLGSIIGMYVSVKRAGGRLEVINLSGARQQVMGGIVDGYGHAMFGKLTFTDGETDQKNYNSYRLIRMREIPEILPHFVDNGIDPTGLGEPALPPTGGAVANAIFKATGSRIKNQPFNEHSVFTGKKLKSTMKNTGIN